MSVREERLILAAASLISMGRDDRHTPASKAAEAVKQADEVLSRLDDSEPEDDSDADEDSTSQFEKGYDLGVADTRGTAEALARQVQGLRAELADARAAVEAFTKPEPVTKVETPNAKQK